MRFRLFPCKLKFLSLKEGWGDVDECDYFIPITEDYTRYIPVGIKLNVEFVNDVFKRREEIWKYIPPRILSMNIESIKPIKGKRIELVSNTEKPNRAVFVMDFLRFTARFNLAKEEVEYRIRKILPDSEPLWPVVTEDSKEIEVYYA